MKRRIKDPSIETLRGLACVLIVAYHSITVEMVSDGLFGYGYVAHCFRLIRLPLFVTISGYVYAMHPMAIGSLAGFITGKARRILLPWVSVTLLTFGLRAFVHGGSHSTVGAVLYAFWLPIDQLWFLPAIFWVILTVAILEAKFWLSSIKCWVLVCLVAWVPAIFCMVFQPLAIAGYFQLLPFFLLGLGLFRFEKSILKLKIIWFCTVIAAIGLLIHQLTWFGIVQLSSYQYNLLVLFTVYGTQVLIFNLRRGIPLLTWLGHFSFAIFLFHLIAISIVSRLIGAILINNIHVVFLLKLCLGLTLPIVATFLINRSKLLNTVLLGERWS